MSDNLGTAVVTGASAGIGAIYADRLAGRGYDLILTGRHRGRLEAVGFDITQRTGRKVRTIVADLATTDGLARIEDILEHDEAITMLVNNAGLGATAPLLDTNVEEMSEIVKVNINALMRLAYAAAPRFVTRGGGTVINIASALAFYPELMNGVYDASKAFVVALTQSMNNELKDKGVRVQVVCPGVVETEFWDAAGLPIVHLPSEMVMSPDEVVDAALAGLDIGEVVTIPSLPDIADYQALEAARQKMIPNLSHVKAADRYRQPVHA